MASVSIHPPSPAAMSRRAPLTTLPNAVNSPYHSITAAAAKRQRTQRDLSYAQSTSVKDQIVDLSVKTPARVSHAESRIPPNRRPTLRGKAVVGGEPPTFNGISHAQAQRRAVGKHVEQSNIESVRAWQRHYKKVFPDYVFYFESIPEDVAHKCQKQLVHLGARLERFFSNEVTHVVTTRTIPPEGAAVAQTSKSQATTINPSLLDGGLPKAEFTFKAATPSRKFSSSKISQEDSRGVVRGQCDILLKAREYRMKIWALEKFQRMMNAMFEMTSATTTATTPSREIGHAAHVGAPNVDLTHVLRNERLHGPTDRDPNAAPTDIVYFKGYFIYVHDMMGINRPIMVREYQKVSKRENGNWPQFRSVSGGKCPFIEEAVHQKREKERERQIEKMERTRQKEIELSRGRVMKANNVREELARKADRSALVEMSNGERRLNRGGVIGKDGLFQVPPVIPAKRTNVHSVNEVAFTSAYPDKTRCGEPVASGVQPSNITSAIRSQMVSSIADRPGRRAGTSKVMIELNRKVLVGNAASKGIPNSQRMMNLTNAAGVDSQRLAAGLERKRKPGVDHRPVIRDDRNTQVGRMKAKAKEGGSSAKRECHPGYCENCREKFEDFEEHTLSRRHRKFAANDDNWADLDGLLSELKRPLKSFARR